MNGYIKTLIHLKENNMKTHLALIKYLPVEGEIKVGDIYDVHGSINKAPTKKGAIEATKQGYKPLQPFVVTRKIKVGDEVWDEQGDYFGVIKEINQIEDQPMQAISKEGSIATWTKAFGCNLYKKIGEVSKAAYEFAEDGKEYEITIGYDKWHKFKPKEGESPYHPAEIKIKCPTCKHFH